MAKITIITEGIAFIYHKNDDVWRVIFPFDDCHTVKFKLTDKQGDGVSLAGEKRQIRITAQNPASAFGEGDNYNKFLDLTAAYSHKNGIKMKSGWDDRGVLMTIANAVFSVDQMTNSKYLVKENGAVTKRPAKIGYSGKAEIEADSVTVNVTGGDEPDFSMTFAEDCKLYFNNDCLTNAGGGDFSDVEMLYKLLEDKLDPHRKIRVERETTETPRQPARKGKAALRDHNPFPYESGLPCHECRLSDPDDSEGLP